MGKDMQRCSGRMGRANAPPHPGLPSSSWSAYAFPGRSDPGEPRDEGRRSLITIIYYFLCNRCYETWDLVPGTTRNMCKMAPTSKSFLWDDQVGLGTTGPPAVGTVTAWKEGCRLTGLWPCWAVSGSP